MTSPERTLPCNLPCNLEAEQALLGAALIDNRAMIEPAMYLRPEHFFEPLHGRIWEIAVAMRAKGDVVSPITVNAYLPDTDIDRHTSFHDYLKQLARGATTIMNAPEYARFIIDAAKRRAVISAADQAARSAYDMPEDRGADDVLSEAEGLILDVRRAFDSAGKSFRTDIGDASDVALAELDAVMSGEARQGGATTGLKDLDDRTGGFRPGELWLVAGRPGMGKTVTAVVLSLRTARAGNGALMLELEVPRQQIVARYLACQAFSHRTRIGFGDVLNGRIDDAQRMRLAEAGAELRKVPLALDTRPRITIAEIAGAVRLEKDRMSRKGVVLRVVVVDYLKMVTAGDRYRGNRVYEIGEITGAMKSLAKELEVTIVLLVQLNRGPENREDKRPTLADLRDSGDLEQDADVVALLYREAYYLEKETRGENPDPDKLNRLPLVRNHLEIIIDKNRSGQTGTVRVFCDVGSSFIDDLGGAP